MIGFSPAWMGGQVHRAVRSIIRSRSRLRAQAALPQAVRSLEKLAGIGLASSRTFATPQRGQESFASKITDIPPSHDT